METRAPTAAAAIRNVHFRRFGEKPLEGFVYLAEPTASNLRLVAPEPELDGRAETMANSLPLRSRPLTGEQLGFRGLALESWIRPPHRLAVFHC